jgi:hypothetical protein
VTVQGAGGFMGGTLRGRDACGGGWRSWACERCGAEVAIANFCQQSAIVRGGPVPAPGAVVWPSSGVRPCAGMSLRALTPARIVTKKAG